ncbi:MAG: bifunctional folylpolyglutamate synthase/dihydrofolate synthase [Candidatus Omnitrophica bacterium]|nr:bifunctional folylpolyglutamate synthase/dihydrofolate synthase [Candidatus Omnitrophota bacterium]
MLADLGCPEKQYPVIHVVGTKGKGSTCAFLASMLQSSGLKVGLYTSPHLYDLTERIRILMPGKVSGKEAGIFEGKISSRKLEEILRKVKPKIEHLRRQRGFGDFTFFEVLTAVAFYFFAEQNVDVVVAEAGLGGRLDATNVGNSEICVFAPISYDHTQILGSTLKHIAQEKAAVIKASTKVIFSAPQKKEVRFVIEKNAKKYGLKVFYVGRDIQYKIISQNTLAETFSLKGLDHTWPRLKSPLLGEHQVVNASLAAGVVEYFLKAHSLLLNQAVVCGVAKTRWLGRFEILRVNPFVVIDSAHNEDSAKKLAETVAQIFPKRKVIILFGASRDKDIKGILKWLKVISPEIILTRAAHPRSCDFSKEKIKQLQLEGFLITKNVREGFKAALQKSKKGNVILAAGSIFLAGEIRKLCMPKA